jgi:tetratricopeptide (TPR) repeat protein
VVVIAAVAIAGGAFAIVRAIHARVPLPPDVSTLGPLAPEVADIVRQAREGVVESPAEAVRWGRFGMVCEANGLPGAARNAYATAASIDGSEAKWWFRLAAVDARLGRLDDAVRDVQRSIEVNSTYAPSFWHLGLWLLDRNETAAAERAFGRATEIDPADRAGWLGLARVYLQRGENERAAGLLERLLASTTGDRYALQLLGTAYRRLGRNEEAEPALQTGASAEPLWNDPWTDEMLAYRRGYAALLKDATAYIVAGQFDPAIRILERLRQERPNDVVLNAHLGQVYVAAGRDGEGVPLLEQVTAQQPDRFEALVDLATGYMHQGDLARARRTVERALTLNSSFAPAYETLGLVLWRAGNMRDAVSAFENAVRFDPRNARALVWIGMVQTNAGRTADALTAFQHAVRISPTNVDAWIGIANAQMTRGDLDGAAQALDRATRLEPDRPVVKETAKRLRSLHSGAAQP